MDKGTTRRCGAHHCEFSPVSSQVVTALICSGKTDEEGVAELGFEPTLPMPIPTDPFTHSLACGWAVGGSLDFCPCVASAGLHGPWPWHCHPPVSSATLLWQAWLTKTQDSGFWSPGMQVT